MTHILSVAFEAHSSEQNQHRRYEIIVGRDLLNDWTLTFRYGRVGQVAQRRHYGSADPNVIRRIIRKSLMRRLSAPKRIGCAYHLSAFNADTSHRQSDWLPSEVMARFFHAA
jgi:WGR domain